MAGQHVFAAGLHWQSLAALPGSTALCWPPFTDLLGCPPACLPACLQVRTTVKRLDGAPLDKFPLYYDEVHPWAPTGHRCV